MSKYTHGWKQLAKKLVILVLKHEWIVVMELVPLYTAWQAIDQGVKELAVSNPLKSYWIYFILWTFWFYF